MSKRKIIRIKEQTQTNRKILKDMKKEHQKNQTTLTNCEISFDIHAEFNTTNNFN